MPQPQTLIILLALAVTVAGCSDRNENANSNSPSLQNTGVESKIAEIDRLLAGPPTGTQEDADRRSALQRERIALSGNSSSTLTAVRAGSSATPWQSVSSGKLIIAKDSAAAEAAAAVRKSAAARNFDPTRGRRFDESGQDHPDIARDSAAAEAARRVRARQRATLIQRPVRGNNYMN